MNLQDRGKCRIQNPEFRVGLCGINSSFYDWSFLVNT